MTLEHGSTRRARSVRVGVVSATALTLALGALPMAAGNPAQAAGAQDQRGWANTELHFRNSTADTVSVAIMYYAPEGCADHGDWATKGWWKIAPGKRVHVKNTNNRYAYFHAHSRNRDWSGDRKVHVKSAAFESCVDIASTDSRVVGMRRIDLGPTDARPYTSHTVTLR